MKTKIPFCLFYACYYFLLYMPKTILLRYWLSGTVSPTMESEYLDEIAISAGKHIIVANTYIGGCSIQRHLDNARHDKHDYKYRKI